MRNEERYKQEILAVKSLGEAIGYGNMMDIASALWAISLEDKHQLNTGAFIATIPDFIKKKEAERIKEHLINRKNQFRKLLSTKQIKQ